MLAQAHFRQGDHEAAEGRQRLAIETRMFEAAQLHHATVTAGTIARTVARFADTDPAMAALVRRSQEATRRRDRLRLEFG